MKTAFTLFHRNPAPLMQIDTCLRRMLAHISPRRSAMERKGGIGTYIKEGLEHIAPMPGALSMNKRRAR